MGSIVEVTATPTARAALQAGGPMKHVRVVSKPSDKGDVRRLFVADLSDLEGQVEPPLPPGFGSAVWVATKRGRPTAAALQRFARWASRFRVARGEPFVSPTVDVVRRVVKAHALGAETQLVATATVEGEKLVVWSCEPARYECSLADIRPLAGLDQRRLSRVEVSASGSRLRWPLADVDVDLDLVRELADPRERKAVQQAFRREATSYGQAIRRLRVAAGLRQSGIEGLSEREVRRVEKGEVFPHAKTLAKLASAHGRTMKEYLGQIANESRTAVEA